MYTFVVYPPGDHINCIFDHHHSMSASWRETRCGGGERPVFAIRTGPDVPELRVGGKSSLSGDKHQLVVVHDDRAPLRGAHEALAVCCSHLTPSDEDHTSFRKYRPDPMLEW